MSAPTARQALRAATPAHHERVDAAFGRCDLSDLGRYGNSLEVQAHGFPPVEAALDRSAVADFAAFAVSPPDAAAIDAACRTFALFEGRARRKAS